MTKAMATGISKYKFHGHLGGKSMKILISRGRGEGASKKRKSGLNNWITEVPLT